MDFFGSNPANGGDDRADAVLIDLDTVMLGMHQGRRGVELNLMADMPASLDRLREVARRIVVLVGPPPPTRWRPTAAKRRPACKRCTAASAPWPTSLDIVAVSARRGPRLRLRQARQRPGRGGGPPDRHQAAQQLVHRRRPGRHPCGARKVGLRTVRIGPLGGDHLSSVHRPDYEARDLLDAANTIMLDALTPAG